MKLSICIPTRGVIFARTVNTILHMPKDSSIIIVEGLPIPEAHNECIRQALLTDCTHIWFLEEDMALSDRQIASMIVAAQHNRFVTMDYHMNTSLNCVQYDQGKPIYTGFGCTMFDRTIFEKEFHDPWLTDAYDIMILGMNPFQYKIEKRSYDRPVYGKYDVYFSIRCMELGIPIHVIPDMLASHLRLASWERKETNKAPHQVYEI